jgi:hypothetical protein
MTIASISDSPSFPLAAAPCALPTVHIVPELLNFVKNFFRLILLGFSGKITTQKGVVMKKFTQPVFFYSRPQDAQAFKAAAAAQEMTLSEWCRVVLTREAQKVAKQEGKR